MLEWYLEVNALFRAIRQKAIDAQGRLENDDAAGAKLINGYLKTDYQALRKLWTDAGFPQEDMGNLGRHIGFGEANDYDDILERDLPHVEARAEAHARQGADAQPRIGFEDLLHPVIYAHAFQHYLDGHYRDAVLNAIVAIFDLMRERTGLDLDGSALVTQVLSLENPHLILSELGSDSGRNDQKGFMQILAGSYLGIRNPKAHSLNHDLDAEKAAQYLIFASLLARRIYEANAAPKAKSPSRSRRQA
ncbi:TIGR02391 family protein [Variovorax sp.]|jgi:uncharacterized protein (TIGR02391 family)|uniref:TIGR02391 family protein n=1 Tax=Variovorax sp. TaxID=1871043 RepID=UPI001ACD0E4E|nr:TIGR02391 family protein [Burkholderiales bacterium]MBO9355661.1 TIGR02391 family protein [Bordetella petrii]